MELSNAFATNPGKRAEGAGKLNEDFAHAWEKDGVYYQIVADGNGRDEILNPAAFIVNEIQRFIDVYSTENMTVEELKTMISGAVHCANRVLLAFKKANGEKYANNVFASFDLTAISKEMDFITAHCGDSRVYLVRVERLHQLSKDHTEAQRLCDEGKISREQIFQHPDRDTLTSALGFESPKCDIVIGKVRKGDMILLLTDGVHKVLSLSQLHEIIFQSGNCFDTCNNIIEAVNMLGGPDNASVCMSYIAS